MKKFLALVLSCLLVLAVGIPAFAEEVPIDVEVDGSLLELDAAPFMENDICLVPIRAFSVALGIADENITFSDGLVSISGTPNGQELSISLMVGEDTASVNGEEISLTIGIEQSCASRIVSDRTFVPMRFINHVFGCTATFYEAMPEEGKHSLLSVKSPAYTAFTIGMSQAAMDAGVDKLMEVAAAVTGVNAVTCVVLQDDAWLEKLNLMLAAGEPLIVLDEGTLTDEVIEEKVTSGAFAKLDDAIAKYSPSAMEWIEGDEEVKNMVTASDGSIVAFPVERNQNVERLFISSVLDTEKAVNFVHGYREVVKGLTESADGEENSEEAENTEIAENDSEDTETADNTEEITEETTEETENTETDADDADNAEDTQETENTESTQESELEE